MTTKPINDSSIPPPALSAECITPITELFTEMEGMSPSELTRLRGIIRTIKQLTSKRTKWIITSHRVVMSAKGITTEDVLRNRFVHRRIWTRLSAIASPLPAEPIPKGILDVSIALIFDALPTSAILEQSDAHNMAPATPLHLAALINAEASLIGPHPIITFGKLRFGRRWLETHLLPYSVRRTNDKTLLYEVHKPDFWVNGKDRVSPIQLLLVPKTA